MSNFVEIDGRRFELGPASLELYHCDFDEADWNLAFDRPAELGGPLWLAGTVELDPRRATELDGLQLSIEGRDLDGLFETLLGAAITTYPNGHDVCRAWFVASMIEGGDVRLVSAFEFDWDRYLDPPEASYPEPRRARLEIVAAIAGLHPGELP